MKPIKINIAGFNSFRENVTINFEELARRGIFGIFGKTGSGKSTILDAITFALYGVISRYGSKYGNCVNENEQEAKVELEFVLNDTSEHRYVVRRSIKRKSSGDYNSPYAILIDKSAGNLPIAERIGEVNQKIEELLGLNYEEFVKTVVLPQGSFKDFLVMGGKERREILARIFELEKYGDKLQKATSKRKEDTQKAKERIDATILTLGDVSDEKLKNGKVELKLAKEFLSEMYDESKRAEIAANEAIKVLESRKKLASLEYQLAQLEEDADRIERLREAQNKSEKAEKIMPMIGVLNDIERKAAQVRKEAKSVELTLNEEERSAEKWVREYQRAKEKYEQNYARGIEKKSRLELAEREFDEYTQNAALLEESEKKSKELQKIRKQKENEINSKEFQKAEISKELEELEREIEEVRELLLQEASTKEAFGNYKSAENLAVDIAYLQKEIMEGEGELTDRKQQESEIAAALQEAKRGEIDYYIEKIRNELHEGDVCPICNSKIGNEIHSIENEYSKILKSDGSAERLQTELGEVQTALARKEALLGKAKDELKDKEAEFIDIKEVIERHYSNFTLEELTAKLKAIDEAKNGNSLLEGRLREFKASVDSINAAIEKLNLEIAEQQRKESALSAELEVKQKIQEELHASICEVVGEFANPNVLKQTVEIALKGLQADLDSTNEKKEKSEKNLSELRIKLSSIQSQYDTLLEEKKKRFMQITEQLSKYYAFEIVGKTQEEAHQAVRNKLCEVESEYLETAKFEDNRRILEKYSQELATVKGKIEELKSDAGGEDRSGEELEFLIRASEDIKERIVEQEKKVALQAKAIEEITDKLELKKAEEAKLTLIDKRLSLLTELQKLFSGGKFAEYIAFEQLKYITKAASATLLKITAGKYELVVDDEGVFKIRDFKNGGIIRDVKSMSGGETFVVSLSLALALSAQLQLKGRAPIELFFLDEGFGTLDEELLDTVMDSLERLASDRFKIGIVSHVEQLKQRMPVKLIVIPAEIGKGGSKVIME